MNKTQYNINLKQPHKKTDSTSQSEDDVVIVQNGVCLHRQQRGGAIKVSVGGVKERMLLVSKTTPLKPLLGKSRWKSLIKQSDQQVNCFHPQLFVLCGKKSTRSYNKSHKCQVFKLFFCICLNFHCYCTAYMLL